MVVGITLSEPKASCGSGAASATFNIASCLASAADRTPQRAAVVVTRACDAGGRAIYDTLSFAQLEALSNRYAGGLSRIGLGRGARTLVMVRPGFEFLSLTFALFKIGAVPVMIDPGMGVGRMLDCIRQVNLDAFVGVPSAHVVRLLRRRAFKNLRHVVTVGRRWFWGGVTLEQLSRDGSERFSMVETDASEPAAILFTSGSTGPAKGVVYEHGMFGAQVRMIQSYYGIEPGEVDLPAFPLFALFSVAMGMTAVIPDMDASRPARVDPAKLVRAIHDHKVTSTFGSPAIWRRVASYCTERRIKLPSLRRVLIAGAPVSPEVIAQLHEILDDGADVHTPFGATEALPVSSISGREVLEKCRDKTRRGAGTCVGGAMEEIELRLIRISDQPIAAWSDDLLVLDGAFGEIVVAGPVVTTEYFGQREATAAAKIRDGDRIWHRMGDIGYRDASGRLWFCGRKAHRVETESGTMFSVCCEAIFNEHPKVARSALVGVGQWGKQEPVIVVEPREGSFPRGARVAPFVAELRQLARSNERTSSIQSVLFRRRLPVDVRHNAKINRESLARWAARRLR